jgi:hypothetical protein
MSRTGKLKSRPGTLVDSGERAEAMRLKSEERTKMAAGRKAKILEEKIEKASKNAQKIKLAGERKARSVLRAIYLHVSVCR